MLRRFAVREGLVDSVDLMVICVESGISVDETISRISEDLRHSHPETANEFFTASRQMQRGTSWGAALFWLSDRIGAPDLKAIAHEQEGGAGHPGAGEERSQSNSEVIRKD